MNKFSRLHSPSPEMRDAKKFQIQVVNTLKNLVANLGTQKDKRSHVNFEARGSDVAQLNNMYQADWISRKVIDAPVDDMTRKWRSFQSSELTPEQVKALQKSEKKLKTKKKFNNALKWGELHGGSVIYLGVDGAGKPEEPLELDRVKPGSLKFLNVIERSQLTPTDLELNDPTSVNYKRPVYYKNKSQDKIHHTRLLTFDGSLVPFEQYKKNGYWHNSFLLSGWDAVINSQSFADIIVSLAFEAKVDVINIEGLMQQLAKDQGTKELQERFGLADMLKSINNTLLLDAKETHSRSQINFGGLEGLLKTYLSIVSAAFDIPAHRLLGTSAPGLNASGESDRSNYYDMVASKQEAKMDDNLTYYDEIFLRSELGQVPKDWVSEWVSLWQVSETAKADIELKNAQRDALYTGTLPRSVIVKELKENGTYQFIDEDLIKDLEDIEGIEREGETEDDDESDTDTDDNTPNDNDDDDGQETDEEDENQGAAA